MSFVVLLLIAKFLKLTHGSCRASVMRDLFQHERRNETERWKVKKKKKERKNWDDEGGERRISISNLMFLMENQVKWEVT